MARPFPVGPVDGGIQAHAVYGYAKRVGLQHFLADLLDPSAAARADMAGLRDRERSSIAVLDRAEQMGERKAPCVPHMPAQAYPGAVLPLVVVVVVDTDQVEVTPAAAEFRLAQAAEHVPGLELMTAMHGRRLFQIRAAVHRRHQF